MGTDIMPKEMQTFFDKYTTTDITQSERIICTPSEFAKANLFYIQEAGRLKSIKSHISQREHLDSYLFLIVISGRGHITYMGKRRELSSGKCLLINCNNGYLHQSSEDDPWELMWVHFNGKNILPLFKYYEKSFPEVVFHTDVVTDFTDIIEYCLELGQMNDITSEFLISKMLTDLMTLCVVRKADASQNNIRTIKQYIDNNYKSKISLSDIAGEFYINKHYLAREFKKLYGMTVGDYINGKRVNNSKQLLRFTNKSIDDIASLCGIPDANYFAKVFRKIENCSPSEYRKKW